jgi:hypothetical protein
MTQAVSAKGTIYRDSDGSCILEIEVTGDRVQCIRPVPTARILPKSISLFGITDQTKKYNLTLARTCQGKKAPPLTFQFVFDELGQLSKTKRDLNG